MATPDTRKTIQPEFPRMWSGIVHVPWQHLESGNPDYVSQIIRYKKADILQETIGDIWNRRRYVIQFSEEMETVSNWNVGRQPLSYARPNDLIIKLYLRVWAVADPLTIGECGPWVQGEWPRSRSRWTRIKEWIRRVK